MDTPIFIGIALSEDQAIAVKSAAMVVFTSSPIRLPLTHPLYQGAVIIERALNAEYDKREDEEEDKEN